MQAICKRARFPEVCLFPHTIHKAQKTQCLYPGHGMLMDVDMHSTLPCSSRLARRLHRL
jgi:hypothetical protein